MVNDHSAISTADPDVEEVKGTSRRLSVSGRPVGRAAHRQEHRASRQGPYEGPLSLPAAARPGPSVRVVSPQASTPSRCGSALFRGATTTELSARHACVRFTRVGTTFIGRDAGGGLPVWPSPAPARATLAPSGGESLSPLAWVTPSLRVPVGLASVAAKGSPLPWMRLCKEAGWPDVESLRARGDTSRRNPRLPTKRGTT